MIFKSGIIPAVLSGVVFSIGACAGSLTPTESGGTSQSPDISQPAATDSGKPVSVFPKTLSLCRGLTVSNAPASADNRQITTYKQYVTIGGSKLAVAPVETACLSSGYGLRGERLHKGIDLHEADAVDIYAAADGRVKQKYYRDDYGNMLVIEHGEGVFARYAHLESFADGLAVGDHVSVGQTIGIMGNTASYRIPRHLHYEVLTGEWGAFSGSFGLTPVDLFERLPQN